VTDHRADAAAGAAEAAETEEELFGLSDEQVREVRERLAEGNVQAVEELVEPLHAADVADLFERLTHDERRLLAGIVRHVFEPEILTWLDETVREDVIDILGPQEVAQALSELDTDDAVDLLEDLDEEEKQRILATLPAEDRALLVEGLTYPEESAGRLMQRELVAVPTAWTVGETID